MPMLISTGDLKPLLLSLSKKSLLEFDLLGGQQAVGMRASSWNMLCYSAPVFISTSPTYSLPVLQILMNINKQEMKKITISLPLLKIRLNHVAIMQIFKICKKERVVTVVATT